MIRTGSQFSFEVPDGWRESRDGARFVFHPPAGSPFQELIVQGSEVTGRGAEAERQAIVSKVFDNAVASLRSVLASEPFEVLTPLGPDKLLQEPPAWTVEARAPTDGTLFCGAVFRGASGILFATLEAAAQARSIFRHFAESVKVASRG